jgi:hypothetical protein
VPKSREALLVCMADKICASFETLKVIEYNKITSVISREKSVNELRRKLSHTGR